MAVAETLTRGAGTYLLALRSFIHTDRLPAVSPSDGCGTWYPHGLTYKIHKLLLLSQRWVWVMAWLMALPL